MADGTLLGPLTTVWTAPRSCRTLYPQCSTCNIGWFGQKCVSTEGDVTAHIEDDPSCWPPRTTGVADHTWPLGGWGFYSPGLECPAGYTSACGATQGGQSDWSLDFALRPRETAIGCCPEGFTCTNVPGQTCVATASRNTVVPISYCSGNLQGAVPSYTFPDRVTITTTNSNGNTITGVATRPIPMNAPMFQLNYQATDIETTASTTSAAESSQTSSSTSTSTADPTNGDDDSGLSTGAKIGIGVGVGLGALVLVGLLAFWLLKRRKSKQPPVAELGGSTSYEPVATNDYKPVGTPGHQSVFSELSGDTQPSELPAQRYS